MDISTDPSKILMEKLWPTGIPSKIPVTDITDGLTIRQYQADENFWRIESPSEHFLTKKLVRHTLVDFWIVLIQDILTEIADRHKLWQKQRERQKTRKNLSEI